MDAKRLKVSVAEIVEDDITADLLFDYFLLYHRAITYLPSTLHQLAILNVTEQHLRPPLYGERWISRYIDEDFFRHFRMYRRMFEKFLNDVGHHFAREQYLRGKPATTLEKGLLMTLWYLAKGDTLISVSDRFNVSLSTAHRMLKIVVDLINKLNRKYIRWPTADECNTIALDFFEKGGYPDVIGAIDGCHIAIKAPDAQQDSYLNRKFFHSVLLQGICTSKKVFTNVFVGFPGCAHDARVLRESGIYKQTSNYETNRFFYGDQYHLIGDSAYPCLSWLMKPFRDTGRLSTQQKRHNSVLSKTRVAIENTFGLCKERWRILKYVNVYSVERAVEIIMACCILHNFCLFELGDDDNQDVGMDELSEVETVVNHENEQGGVNKRDNICNSL